MSAMNKIRIKPLFCAPKFRDVITTLIDVIIYTISFGMNCTSIIFVSDSNLCTHCTIA